MEIAHTYKGLMLIAGHWPTVQIRNDYVLGSDHFTISCGDKSASYQNDDVLNVAGCALNYNGLTSREYSNFFSRIYDQREKRV